MVGFRVVSYPSALFNILALFKTIELVWCIGWSQQKALDTFTRDKTISQSNLQTDIAEEDRKYKV